MWRRIPDPTPPLVEVGSHRIPGRAPEEMESSDRHPAWYWRAERDAWAGGFAAARRFRSERHQVPVRLRDIRTHCRRAARSDQSDWRLCELLCPGVRGRGFRPGVRTGEIVRYVLEGARVYETTEPKAVQDWVHQPRPEASCGVIDVTGLRGNRQAVSGTDRHRACCGNTEATMDQVEDDRSPAPTQTSAATST